MPLRTFASALGQRKFSGFGCPTLALLAKHSPSSLSKTPASTIYASLLPLLLSNPMPTIWCQFA